MNWATVDWIIISVLAAAGLGGARLGFLGTILSLAPWVFALMAAKLFADDFARMLEPWLSIGVMRQGALLLILFLAALMAVGLVKNLAQEFIDPYGLSGAERILGMAFGLFRGGVIVAVFVGLLHYMTSAGDYRWYRESALIPEIVSLIERLEPRLRDLTKEFSDAGHARPAGRLAAQGAICAA